MGKPHDAGRGRKSKVRLRGKNSLLGSGRHNGGTVNHQEFARLVAIGAVATDAARDEQFAAFVGIAIISVFDGAERSCSTPCRIDPISVCRIPRDAFAP
jgi:hypothetical protein